MTSTERMVLNSQRFSRDEARSDEVAFFSGFPQNPKFWTDREGRLIGGSHLLSGPIIQTVTDGNSTALNEKGSNYHQTDHG